MILNEKDTNRIRLDFFYSAAEECLLSLHVMSNPEHHDASRKWAVHKRRELSSELREEIDFIGENYAGWLFVADVVSYITQQNYPKRLTVEEVMSRLREMDNEDFAYLFLGFPAFDYDRKIIGRWLENPGEINEEELGLQAQLLSVDRVRAFAEDIDGFKKRIEWAVSRYWEECFSKEWPAIDSYLSDMLKKEELVFRTVGFYGYMNGIHDDLTVEKGSVVFHKNPDYSVDIRKLKDIIINLSVFGAPHLLGNVVGGTMSVTRNLNFHSVKMQEKAPENVIKLLEAVSDGTRLKIMKMLWNSQTTTKELSEVLDLSPSTVSLHLKVLREAGLVETSKIKKYVYYRLKKEEIETLQNNLKKYFEY